MWGRAGHRHWSGPAWGAIGVTASFIAITCWWLTVDRSVQYNDAAQHLYFAFLYHDYLSSGRLLRILDYPSFYPPGTYLLGSLAAFVGGINVATPIVAQNIVYVPLLALGCYHTGRMVAGPRAGLLAVVFALGAPLVIEQFHVFMLDAPQAALVAVAVWLILASERFSRVGVAALAGLVVGVGLTSKELMPFYLVGLLPVVLLRDRGWRNWRGLAAFAGIALVVGSPWYLRRFMLSEFTGLIEAASPRFDVPPAAAPPFASLANLGWYFWATLDGLLFAPLFAFAVVGTGSAIARVRRSATSHADPTPELLCGLLGAWLVLTAIPHHDMRYTVSLIVFLAVLGTAWIVQLASLGQGIAIAALVLAVLASQMGATFGVGGHIPALLPGNRNPPAGEGVSPRSRVIVYANHDFMVSGPERDGDLLALLKRLRRDHVTTIAWKDLVDVDDPYFEDIGIQVFARIAKLHTRLAMRDPRRLRSGQAMAIRAHARGAAPPCTRLTDGSGVWVRVADARGIRDYCPA